MIMMMHGDISGAMKQKLLREILLFGLALLQLLQRAT